MYSAISFDFKVLIINCLFSLCLQEKLFLTDANFVSAFAQLDTEISKSKASNVSNWNVEVTEMNKDNLCFEVEYFAICIKYS